MRIVIAGAGDIGYHLATALVDAGHSLNLIDSNEDILQVVANNIDALTLLGDASSVDVLNRADVVRSDIYIATTTSESTNLLSCILAKKIGAKKTIARISNNEYLHENQRRNFLEVGIDNLFSPTLLAAQEIERLINRCSATDIFEFEEGKLSIVGYTVENNSPYIGKTFDSLCRDGEYQAKTIALLRNGKTSIPKFTDKIDAADHVYLVSNAKKLSELDQDLGEELKVIKHIMLIGDTEIAFQTARLLEQNYALTVVIENENKSKKFYEKLEKALVVAGDPSNLQLLKEEGLERMDAFIALTVNSETNIISSLTADQMGVFRSIALVDNAAYTHLSQKIGVDTLINKKLIAANNIFRYVRKGQVEAIASLHGVEAEIIEYVVHSNSYITQRTIGEIGMPKDALIVGVVRRDKGIIPNNDFMLEIEDKVIVLTLPKSTSKVEDIFK